MRPGLSVLMVTGGLSLLTACQNPLESAADRIGREREAQRQADRQNEIQAAARNDFQQIANDVRPMMEFQNEARALLDNVARDANAQTGR
jgi:hypothetical protein